MQVSISINDKKIIDSLENLSPEQFMSGWASEIMNLAINNAIAKAQESNGRSFWQKEVAGSVLSTLDSSQGQAIIYSDSPIAVHTHTGGTIKPRYRKYLAIPIDKSVKGKYPSELADGLIVVRKKDDGPRGRAYLAKPMQKGIKILYVLKNQVNQKPRPWWPDDAEVQVATLQFFDQYIPKKIQNN